MAKSKSTVDSKGNAIYLRIEEIRDHGYYHLYARVCTQQYENSAWQPYGVDDDYSDGLKWSGLRVSCQGDEQSQTRAGRGESGSVYGFSTEYHDCWKLDLRTVRRMAKTLETIDRKMDKLQEARGYVASYGEYLGRVAEVLGCAGFCFTRDARSADISGQKYEFTTVGDGVNRANHRIYLWQQEAVQTAQSA
jgi:hypothetical protein